MKKLINSPMHELRLWDFASAKSGRDAFSNMRLPKLLDAVSSQIAEAARQAFPNDDALVAKCLRWHLRGLDSGKAIRKVKTDLEVASNAKAAWVGKAGRHYTRYYDLRQ